MISGTTFRDSARQTPFKRTNSLIARFGIGPNRCHADTGQSGKRDSISTLLTNPWATTITVFSENSVVMRSQTGNSLARISSNDSARSVVECSSPAIQ